jgi:hypothetical protein
MATLSGRLALLLLLCAGSPGCLSAASHLGAAPTPLGSKTWGIALDGLLFERGRSSFVLPALQLSGRKGMGEDWDAGFRAYALGLEVGTRHRLLSRGRLTLGAMPSLELAFTPVTNNTVELLHGRVRGALVADWRFAPDWTLTLGARLAFGGAAPPTWFRGYGEGAVLLAQPEGLASLAVALNPQLQLRLEAGAGVPLQVRGSARPVVGTGGLSLTWTGK